MTLIIFMIVVLVVALLLCYAVQLIPLPANPPPIAYIKPLLMILIVVVAALLILQRAGVAL